MGEEKSRDDKGSRPVWESELDTLSDSIFTYEGLFNTKEWRLDQANPEDAGDRYVDNNRKEELCLEYVDNFVRQFEALFPERKKLFVTPKNEFGVPKFVCTTVRPTQLPFKSLYNVRTAAEFFADFLQYEPLADPTSPPKVLPSPTFTLENQIGDSFELSTLLCSFLVGSGYDAYCVLGYAPKDVTLLNRSKEVCPVLNQSKWSPGEEDDDNLHIEDLRANKKDGMVTEEEEIDWSAYVIKQQQANENEENGDQVTNENGETEEGATATETGEDASETKTGESTAEEKAGDIVDNENGNESKDEQDAGERKQSEGMDGGLDQGVEGKEEHLVDENGEPVEGAILAGQEEQQIQQDGANAASNEDEEDPYAVEFTGVKESVYLQKMQARIESQAAEAKKEEDEEEEEDDIEDEPETADPLFGQRIHCWVLVRAGKRMVDQSFFVEPTTGKLYHVYGSPYQGVEAIWNNRNYWVNMQQQFTAENNDKNKQESKGNDDSDPMNISYNLDIEEHWEYIYVDGVETDKNKNAAVEEHDVNGAIVADDETDDQKSEAKEPEGQILDLPPSWVGKLTFSREAYRRRYNTTGQRTQLFYKSKLESYSEHLHPHGLVKRLVLFKDRARTIPIEVREYFANRRDKLNLRVRFPLEGRVLEYFAEGRSSGLKLIDEVVGKSRVMHFYPAARLDGLVEREELIGERIVEQFEGRDDHLEVRAMKLMVLGNEDGDKLNKGATAASSSALKRSAEEKKSDTISKGVMTLPRASMGGDLAILKMKQVFSRNPDVDADADIHKRSFDLNAGTISVIYHYATGKIVRSTRLFHKDASIAPEIKLSGTFAQPLRPSQVEEEFQMNLQAEKDCYQSIRDAEREMQDILALRKREESTIILEKSIFDTAREKSKQDTIKQSESTVQEEKDPRHVDYLTPFLQHIPNIKKIKRNEAEAARDACLKSLKERLLERANIIQCRLDEENAQLAKKQAAFQRSRDHVDGADQEFERFCSEAMFRIQILEQRLARHEESALSVYANLDQKLRNDPRLSILYNNN